MEYYKNGDSSVVEHVHAQHMVGHECNAHYWKREREDESG